MIEVNYIDCPIFRLVVDWLLELDALATPPHSPIAVYPGAPKTSSMMIAG